MEVSYGNAKNVTLEINLRDNWSRFKLQYGIVRQGLQSGVVFYCRFKLIGKGGMEDDAICNLSIYQTSE